MAAADFVLDNSVAMRWALPNSNSPSVRPAVNGGRLGKTLPSSSLTLAVLSS